MSASLPPSPPGLPLVGHAAHIARAPYEYPQRIHETVGPIVHVTVPGVDIVSVAHPDLVESVLVEKRGRIGKSKDFERIFGDGILSAEGAQWSRQRDALGSFFHAERVRGYADDMTRIVDQRLDRWADGETVPLWEETKNVTLEILFETLLGRSIDPEGADSDLKRAVQDVNEWSNSTSWVLPEWLPTPARRRYRRGSNRLNEAARAVIDGAGSDGENMLSTLVQLRDTDQPTLSATEIESQVRTLLFAGHDTTAVGLTHTLQLINRNPAVRRELQRELDDVLDGDRPTLADLGSLPVTERVVRETLRLYPPVYNLPRVVNEPVELQGYDVPAGTVIMVCTLAIHRDSRWWDDPKEWRPDRWKDRDADATGYEYVPFGAGPRTCLGRRFALLELRLLVATVVQRYDLAPLSTVDIDPGITSQPADDVPVKVIDRGST